MKKFEITNLSEDQLALIIRCLEVYSRAKLGQFDIMVEQIFNKKPIDWETRDLIKNTLRYLVFGPDCELTRNKNMSWGIYSEEAGDAMEAYEMMKKFQKTLALSQDDDKIRPLDNRFDGPLKDGDHLPQIKETK